MPVRWFASTLVATGCPVCGDEGGGALCRRCLADLAPLLPPCCDRCGVPLPAGAPDHLLCGACRRRGRPVIRSAFAYRGALRDLLLRWKFGPDRIAGSFLSPLLIEGLVRWYPSYRPDLVIPVPPTLAALRERHFCPALDLALAAAEFLGTPCLRDAFAHRGAAQVGRRKKEREQSMRGAITPRRTIPGRRLRILVVDDVVTTGATLREMVRAVRSAAREPEIRSITLARTLSPPSLDLG